MWVRRRALPLEMTGHVEATEAPRPLEIEGVKAHRRDGLFWKHRRATRTSRKKSLPPRAFGVRAAARRRR